MRHSSYSNNNPERGSVEGAGRRLMQLAQDATAAGRGRLAQEISSFFEIGDLTAAERRIAVDIMANLLRQAERDIKEALAERLSVLENVPAEVIIFLANEDTVSVAGPVLRRSKILSDFDLIYIIASKGTAHWQEIARREHLTPVIADRLVDTGDGATALNLIGNPHIALSKNSVRKLIRASLQFENLQEPLLGRPEMDRALVADLYACASQALRQQISERHYISMTAIESSLEALAEELSQEAKGRQTVTPALSALAQQFRKREEISPALMLKTLRRGQVSFFIALVAEKLSLDGYCVEKLIREGGSGDFATICRAIGMMKAEFASIYLLAQHLRTGDKVIDPQELAAALRYYDTIADFDAEHAVMRWRKKSRNTRG